MVSVDLGGQYSFKSFWSENKISNLSKLENVSTTASFCRSKNIFGMIVLLEALETKKVTLP